MVQELHRSHDGKLSEIYEQNSLELSKLRETLGKSHQAAAAAGGTAAAAAGLERPYGRCRRP